MVDLTFMYKKYFNYIRRVVINMINEDPDDIAQLAFVKLSTAQYINEEHGKAFLITVAKNMCIDYVRKRKRERDNISKMIKEFDTYEDPLTEQEQNAADLAQIHADVIEFIHQEIKKLPTATRKVFELHLAGLPPKEIATTLNIAYQTACNHLQAARTKLKIEILFNKKEVLQLLTKPPTL